MTPRFTQALVLAAQAHEGQCRKGTSIPYIVHPVGVAGLVARYEGDEDLQIAALLHDVLEDGGLHFEGRIAHFGDRVLRVVHGCTDGVPDAMGQKADWKERKTTYLEHLREADEDTLLVSGCDKLYNALSIEEDLIEVGASVFARFKAGRDGTLWYYGELAEIFRERECPVAPALSAAVEGMRQLASQ
jgi:(p)ppGpp synthase/HD superfamily hydrolase